MTGNCNKRAHLSRNAHQLPGQGRLGAPGHRQRHRQIRKATHCPWPEQSRGRGRAGQAASCQVESSQMPNRNQAQQIVRNAQKKKQEKEHKEKQVQHGPHTHTHTVQLVGSSKSVWGEGRGSKLTGYGHDMLA